MRTLAFVCNDSLTLSIFRGAIIRECVAADYVIHVIAQRDGRTEDLLASGARFTPLDIEAHGRRPWHELATARQLRRLYRRIAPDLIFHYTIKPNIYGSWAAASLGIPFICVVPGLGHFPDVKTPLLRQALRRGYGFAARHAQQVWFLNGRDVAYFHARGWALENAVLLPGEGVDVGYFASAPLPTRERPRVLFVGRLLESKGTRVFAEVASRCLATGARYDFGLLGYLQVANPDGVPPDEVSAWTEAGALTYHGATTDVRPYLRDCEILVLPTYYREGLNRSILEAMATGRPVITTDVPGARELVAHDVTGYVVPPRNAAAVQDALAYHFSKPRAEREEMGRRARQRVCARYTLAAVHAYYYAAIGGASRR